LAFKLKSNEGESNHLILVWRNN